MGGDGAGTWTPPPAAQVTPLTSFPGAECYPAFSPDGTQIAYAWNGETRTDFNIYVQVIGSGQPLRITSEPGSDIAPAWSPDGRHIAYFHHSGGYQLAMMVVSPLGGPARKVTEFRSIHPSAPKTGMSWTADSRWLAWASLDDVKGWPRIEMVSVESGERKILTEPPPGVLGDLYPAFSPGGARLVFVRQNGLRAGHLFVVDLNSEHLPAGEPVRLTFDAAIVSHPSWLAGAASSYSPLTEAANRNFGELALRGAASRGASSRRGASVKTLRKPPLRLVAAGWRSRARLPMSTSGRCARRWALPNCVV
jgi:Tol biopolymer transport system component